MQPKPTPNAKLVYSDVPDKETSKTLRAPGKSQAWVRYERKGRSGKAVTVLERLAISDDELAGMCRELKRALGIGGTVKDHHIELQGDCRERVKPFLAARGYKINF